MMGLFPMRSLQGLHSQLAQAHSFHGLFFPSPPFSVLVLELTGRQDDRPCFPIPKGIHNLFLKTLVPSNKYKISVPQARESEVPYIAHQLRHSNLHGCFK